MCDIQILSQTTLQLNPYDEEGTNQASLSSGTHLSLIEDRFWVVLLVVCAVVRQPSSPTDKLRHSSNEINQMKGISGLRVLQAQLRTTGLSE